jgi:hypothetical protein
MRYVVYACNDIGGCASARLSARKSKPFRASFSGAGTRSRAQPSAACRHGTPEQRAELASCERTSRGRRRRCQPPGQRAPEAQDQDALLAFFDFPAEHWKHLRTTNPIESAFCDCPSAHQGPRFAHGRARHGLQAAPHGRAVVAQAQRRRTRSARAWACCSRPCSAWSRRTSIRPDALHASYSTRSVTPCGTIATAATADTSSSTRKSTSRRLRCSGSCTRRRSRYSVRARNAGSRPPLLEDLQGAGQHHHGLGVGVSSGLFSITSERCPRCASPSARLMTTGPAPTLSSLWSVVTSSRSVARAGADGVRRRSTIDSEFAWRQTGNVHSRGSRFRSRNWHARRAIEPHAN